jgi:large subunit ribosomal protein L15
MDLTNVSTGVHKRKKKRRVGRGIGSGQGKTAGLGHKGQYASAGARLPSGEY